MGAKLTHSLDIINSFGELKVMVPLTTAQIPGTLETLKARKQHYLDERAKVRMSSLLMPQRKQPRCLDNVVCATLQKTLQM